MTNVTVTITPDTVITARSYQTELVEQAKNENLIICLPTGSGKTYIAVMLIKEMASSIRGSWKQGCKRTIFLVKTVQLVEQQSEYIATHTDLTIGKYYGELGVDFWSEDRWNSEFEDHQVLVFTSQVFLNIIDHNLFSLEYVNLLIFDECHHASGDNQYAVLMNKHYDACQHPPRILGLTASISNKKIKPKDLLDYMKELEKTYRARIESGSNRNESLQHGTSVQVEIVPCASYQEQIVKENESLTIPFEILRSMINRILEFLSQKKSDYKKVEGNLSHTILETDYRGNNISEYERHSSDYTVFTQSQSEVLTHWKRYLENLVEVGLELGLYGFLLFARDLRRKLKSNPTFSLTINRSTREIITDISQRFECLVDDILLNLYRLNAHNDQILFSPKVHQLLDRIIDQQTCKDGSSRCIVFVERVYTANILSQVLTDLVSALQPPWNTRLKIKHVTGVKPIFSAQPMTAKYLRQTIKEFRTASLNVLIATSVVEEGLDIPQCDLVVRFNKPSNFSSYMQSKGRARAKENASYVLFMDQSNSEAYQRDQLEYQNYQEIEQMIQRGFSRDEIDDDSIADLDQIPPYRTSAGVVIDATRAAQLITEYCALLGEGQIFPPRFLFYGQSSPYKCILSMPANCPIRDDIICQNRRKKLAKYECCLKMVEKLHEKGELNEHCLPNRHRTLLKIDAPIGNRIFRYVDELFEKKSDSSWETFAKQTATFPLKAEQSLRTWSLYRIDDTLGFVTPSQSIKLPKFNLYGLESTIEVIYLKSIDYQDYQSDLTNFSRYLFEEVFDNMNTDSLLRFDLEQSTFKLLPCLLTKSGDIDRSRIMNICLRKNKPLQTHSEFNDHELYCASHLSYKHFYTYISDQSLAKRASDPWLSKGQSDDNIRTYADHFESKVPNLTIRRDAFLLTMKGSRKPRINYITKTSPVSKHELNDTPKDLLYYPIELLQYAPLNVADLELIYRLPSILLRISQLYRIEQLRNLLKNSIASREREESSLQFLDADQMPTVTFSDYLSTSGNRSLLPLDRLTYEDSTPKERPKLQPSTDILFQAVTRRSASDNSDMENLEILGDCFLKLTVSMSLYHRYPLAGAGALTVEKAKQISNGNLYRIAVQKKLKAYLNTAKITFRGEDANWLPPGYVAEMGTERYQHQRVKRKAFADMIEGLIGALLIATDYHTTMRFMQGLELDVIPLDDQNHIAEIPSILCPSMRSDEINLIVEQFYTEQDFAFVEQTINYRFNSKAYLIAAFTHPSSFANRLTTCYERLEFLGDAVLDFLVTRSIFVTNTKITPGRVTDIRQDLANNGRLAYILVACRLHTKILHNSPDLFGKISSYAGDEDLFDKDSSIDTKLSKDINQWADSTAPKALADVFEALVGAIFLDSGKCLRTVWTVVEPLLRQYIDRSITDPNFNPVRSFFERGGKVVSEFTMTDPKKNTSISVCYVEWPNGDQFIGRGLNKKLAKYDACRKAIR